MEPEYWKQFYVLAYNTKIHKNKIKKKREKVTQTLQDRSPDST